MCFIDSPFYSSLLNHLGLLCSQDAFVKDGALHNGDKGADVEMLGVVT